MSPRRGFSTSAIAPSRESASFTAPWGAPTAPWICAESLTLDGRIRLARCWRRKPMMHCAASSQRLRQRRLGRTAAIACDLVRRFGSPRSSRLFADLETTDCGRPHEPAHKEDTGHGRNLPAWTALTEASPVRELRSLAAGLRKDWAAVTAGARFQCTQTEHALRQAFCSPARLTAGVAAVGVEVVDLVHADDACPGVGADTADRFGDVGDVVLPLAQPGEFCNHQGDSQGCMACEDLDPDQPCYAPCGR